MIYKFKLSLKDALIMITAMRKLLDLFIPPSSLPHRVLEEASYLLNISYHHSISDITSY